MLITSHVATNSSSSLLLLPVPVPMKAWTTPEQLIWLKEQLPWWHKACRSKGEGKSKTTAWVADIISCFFVTFKLSKSQHIKAPSVSSPSLPSICSSNDN